MHVDAKGLGRRFFAVAAMFLALLPARAQEQAPRIVFSPTLGVAQDFRVSYRLRNGPTTPLGTVEDKFSVNYRLTVTPIAREKDGYRLRLLVSEVERPAGAQDMNMVVAAALMLDGLPIEMLVDARGFLKEPADWPNMQRTLKRRADALPAAPWCARSATASSTITPRSRSPGISPGRSRR